MIACKVFYSTYVSNTSKIQGVEQYISSTGYSSLPVDPDEFQLHSLDGIRKLAVLFCDTLKPSQIISISEVSLVGREGTAGLSISVYYKE